MTSEEYSSLPTINEWAIFLRSLLNTTEKFPKKVRFTFVTRLDNIGLEILETLIEACYTPPTEKLLLLKYVNIDLEKLRILIRISYEERYLSHKAYEKLAKNIDDIGKQVGAWIKNIKKRIKNEKIKERI